MHYGIHDYLICLLHAMWLVGFYGCPCGIGRFHYDGLMYVIYEEHRRVIETL